MNLLSEEDNSPQLFLPSHVQASWEFASQKEAEKEQQKKKMQEEIEKKAQADARAALKILREEEK